ncbi:MAG: sigma-70 family RNA polymerase sigma factor [Planctomycetaceae bacterium]|nr:sigma-70 family RNA polymerase sigma factor [Planctomycetaceae bacterium]
MDLKIESSGRSEPSISATLLDRVRSRRPEAWQRFVDLYGPVVYRWCRQLGVGRGDAPDVVQEVFVAVAAGVGRFRRDRPGDSFGAWLRTVTRNEANDFFRHRHDQPNAQGGTTAYRQILNVPESIPDSSRASGNAEEGKAANSRLTPDNGFARRLLDAVRADFEVRTWDTACRVLVDRESPANVAAAMGMSLAAVYQAKSRVLRRLRREMEGFAE